MNSTTVKAVFCVTIISWLLFAIPVMAEDKTVTEMETITVTANKVEEDITDVPQSITVIDDEILKEKGLKNIPEVLNQIPNMNAKSNGAVNFRGLQPSYFTNNNPVVIYIDGVAYSSSSGFDASLLNVERIEVLRGPQGTLYGKDAIGGVIKVVTKEPGNEWHGNIGAEYGSYNDIEGSFNVSGPLIQDKLYLGVNARYQQDDGWITNDYTGDDEANKSNRQNLGAFLLYKPTDRFTAKLTLSGDFYEQDWFSGCGLPGGTDASVFDRDDAENCSFDEETSSQTDSLAQSLHLTYEFDSVTLSSTTTHRDVELESFGDRDRMADTSWDGLIQFNYEYTETWTEEVRVSSNNTEGVRWIAGAYFDTGDMEKDPYGIQAVRQGSYYEQKFLSETESETMAVFGQAMIPFFHSFELTLGGRYQRIEKEMRMDFYYGLVGAGNINPFYSLHADETWDVFLPKAALSYRLNDNWTTYASVAQGYMPGGFNYSAYAGSAEDNTFDPERSTNYEIGVKGKLNRARLAANIFYLDIKDIHISKYDSGSGLYVTDNAGGAHSLGAELDLTYFLTDSIELTVAVGIIDTEYDDYDTGTVVYDGESIAGTPLHTARIGAAYYHPNGFYARGDVASVGEVPYYDRPSKEFSELDGYITANVKIGYRFKKYDIYAFCNNLTDEEYITNFTSSAAKSVATYGDPRTVGIGVRYSF